MPRPGDPVGQPFDWEQRIGRQLPEDVASFYGCLNGTEEAADWPFDIWPLERVGPMPTVVTGFNGIPDFSEVGSLLPDAGEYFAFADVMIWSHVLAVRLAPAQPTDVVWLCDASYARIAPTFGKFWELYLSDIDAALFARNAAVIRPDDLTES